MAIPMFASNILGRRAHRAGAALPQGAAAPIFTISGGRIVLTALIGQVTTVIETAANATKLIANPTVGADQDLCATLDITADPVGLLYGITGTAANAMIGAGSTLFGQLATPVVISEGTIDLSCVGSATGAIAWTIYYVPIDSYSKAVAA